MLQSASRVAMTDRTRPATWKSQYLTLRPGCWAGEDMRQRHYAQVARLRIETAIIEFDADPEGVEGAQKIAAAAPGGVQCR
jgi:hypothetical protein